MAEVKAVIEAAVIRNYKRLSYKLWYAVAEMVDNAIQSNRNNDERLQEARNGEPLEVRVVVDKKNKVFRVSDNAFGMDLETLQNALVHGQPPKNNTGLSEFGMGLKTSACWMGNVWTIRTTELGNSKEYAITYDVEAIADGDPDLHLQESDAPEDAHYTVIEIKDWNTGFAPRTVTAAKEFLSSMYRLETSESDKKLRLLWDEKELQYADNQNFVSGADGTDFKKDIDFKVGGKRVTGWAAVLAPGKGGGGTSKAGFALVRRGRLYKAQPEAWRPAAVFGGTDNRGANNLINQRLTGEIHLDDFDATQQKDDIAWQGTEEEDLGDKLKEAFNDLMYEANKARKGDISVSDMAVKNALAEATANLESDAVIDEFVIQDVPGPTEVATSDQGILDSVKHKDPDQIITIGDQVVKVFTDKDRSINDPYVVFETPPSGTIVVVINMHHPGLRRYAGTGNADALTGYIIHCIVDALAEHKARSKTEKLDPATIRNLKDRLLRAEITSQDTGISE